MFATQPAAVTEIMPAEVVANRGYLRCTLIAGARFDRKWSRTHDRRTRPCRLEVLREYSGAHPSHRFSRSSVQLRTTVIGTESILAAFSRNRFPSKLGANA